MFTFIYATRCCLDFGSPSCARGDASSKCTFLSFVFFTRLVVHSVSCPNCSALCFFPHLGKLAALIVVHDEGSNLLSDFRAHLYTPRSCGVFARIEAINLRVDAVNICLGGDAMDCVAMHLSRMHSVRRS